MSEIGMLMPVPPNSRYLNPNPWNQAARYKHPEKSDRGRAACSLAFQAAPIMDRTDVDNAAKRVSAG